MNQQHRMKKNILTWSFDYCKAISNIIDEQIYISKYRLPIVQICKTYKLKFYSFIKKTEFILYVKSKLYIIYIFLLIKLMFNAQHAPISSLNCTILLVGLPKRERETERITIFARSLCSALSLHRSYIQCDMTISCFQSS